MFGAFLLAWLEVSVLGLRSFPLLRWEYFLNLISMSNIFKVFIKLLVLSNGIKRQRTDFYICNKVVLTSIINDNRGVAKFFWTEVEQLCELGRKMNFERVLVKYIWLKCSKPTSRLPFTEVWFTEVWLFSLLIFVCLVLVFCKIEK